MTVAGPVLTTDRTALVATVVWVVPLVRVPASVGEVALAVLSMTVPLGVDGLTVATMVTTTLPPAPIVPSPTGLL